MEFKTLHTFIYGNRPPFHSETRNALHVFIKMLMCTRLAEKTNNFPFMLSWLRSLTAFRSIKFRIGLSIRTFSREGGRGLKGPPLRIRLHDDCYTITILFSMYSNNIMLLALFFLTMKSVLAPYQIERERHTIPDKQIDR